MNTEEIIDMARQASIGNDDRNVFFDFVIEELEAFAKLVDAKATAREREACAKVCEEGIANADDWNSAHWDQACENRAWAIRARGQA